MTKIENLISDIDNAIETIHKLSPENHLEVHDLALELYKRYCNLNKDVFKTDKSYSDYQIKIKAGSEVMSLEFKGLLNKQEVEYHNKYAQISTTLNGFNIFLRRLV